MERRQEVGGQITSDTGLPGLEDAETLFNLVSGLVVPVTLPGDPVPAIVDTATSLMAILEMIDPDLDFGPAISSLPTERSWAKELYIRA